MSYLSTTSSQSDAHVRTTHHIGEDNRVTLGCLYCDQRILINDVLSTFVDYRKVTCRRCGTDYAVDLYFEDEHDCACLIQYGR